jgi:hypothetical protein
MRLCGHRERLSIRRSAYRCVRGGWPAGGEVPDNGTDLGICERLRDALGSKVPALCQIILVSASGWLAAWWHPRMVDYHLLRSQCARV